jgi:hypothetical protein
VFVGGVNRVCGGRGGGVVRVGLGICLAGFEVAVDVAFFTVRVAVLFAVGVAAWAVGVFVEEDEADNVADEASTSYGKDEDGAGDDYELGWEQARGVP